MSASHSHSSGGGCGCFSLVLFIAVLAALIGAWFWSQGMDPQAATALGLEWSAKITGLACAIPCVLISAVAGLALFLSLGSGRR